MRFDLHSHSTASDGKLSPQALIDLAIQQQLSLFALTDHDTIAGFRQLKSQSLPLTLVSGIEFSCQWLNQGVHIVGLDFDDESEVFQLAVERQAYIRAERAKQIATKLNAKGIKGSYEGALALATNASSIGRPHFARYLISIGQVKTMQQAFKRYLGKGKPGDVKCLWPEITDIIQVIKKAGGVAVLAHPLEYALTLTKLKRLIEDFKLSGGDAIELADAQKDRQKVQWLNKIIQENDLAASAGSDFHDPSAYRAIGRVAVIPANLEPVWERFSRTTQF